METVTLCLLKLPDFTSQWVGFEKEKLHIQFPPFQDLKEGGRGSEHLEVVLALAHAYILCCVNTVKRGVIHPLPPLGETLIYLMIVLVGGAGSEKTRVGRARLRKAFLRLSN